MHRIFRSKFYAGILVSKTYEEEVRGQHEAMITLEHFEKVQAILDGRNNKPSLAVRNPTNDDFPLRRFVKCGKCGSGFTGSWCKGHAQKYPYYWCYKSQKCLSKYVLAWDLHDSLDVILNNTKLSVAGVSVFQLILETEYSKRHAKITMHQAKGKQLIGKLTTMRMNLVNKHLSGLYSDEVFLEQNTLLSENITRLQRSIDAKSIKQYKIKECWDFVNRKMQDFKTTYTLLTTSNKKALLSTIFPGGFVWLYPGLSYPEINSLFRV